ncbi:MAG: hypothetical protein M1820_005981 [Bogoriella megaspora]|nr:MAG: hypothetical protein M1820_005981 [Bogoriella megaspora]
MRLPVPPGVVPSGPTSQISSSPKRSAEDALLYHWHTNTSLIISVVKTPEIQAFWQTEAPWLAQSHPFLMHSLAALAGLHLAQLIPDQSQAYLKEARVRQVQASNLFRSWAAGTLEKRNFRVIFAFAVLTMVSYLATEPITGNNSLDLAHFITWVNLFRYPHRLVRSSLFSSNNDPDALAILRPFGEGKPPTQLRDRAMIDSFESLRSANANSTMSSPDSQTLSDSIDVVEKFFEVTPVRPPDLMTTASWMFMLPEDFFTLLTQRTEIAIALMAHCLMPTCNAPPVWLVTKWSKRAAEASLGILGDRWQTRMHWASTEIQSSSAEIYVFGMDYLAIP